MPFYDLSPCNAQEAAHLLKILSWYSVCADVRQTLGLDEELESFSSTQNAYVNVEYVEVEDKSDVVVLKLGDTNVNGTKINFEVERFQFAKQISRNQISFTMCDQERGLKVWFESDVVPDEAMDELKSHVAPRSVLKVKDLPDGGCVVKYEGVASHFTADEVEEMKREYLLASHKARVGNGDDRDEL